VARNKEPGTDYPSIPPKQDDLAKWLRESEAADPFDEAAQQKLSKLIAEIATKRTKKQRAP
jgi:hypothetical protein